MHVLWTTTYMARPLFVFASALAVSGLGLSFVQPLLSSSYGGYGTASLTQDSEELSVLLSHLKGVGVTDVILCGHSTGCQVLYA